MVSKNTPIPQDLASLITILNSSRYVQSATPVEPLEDEMKNTSRCWELVIRASRTEPSDQGRWSSSATLNHIQWELAKLHLHTVTLWSFDLHPQDKKWFEEAKITVKTKFYDKDEW